MVDANRLPQVLAGSRADRLKRPIDAAGVWLRISRSNGIAEFPVRRDELTEELAPVSTLATTALQTAEGKVDADQVLALLNTAFGELFQEYPLVGGMENRQIDPIDNREYRYTVFAIETRYSGTFEELALVSNDANENLLDVEYGVYKEFPGRIILVFRDMEEGFADGIAKIKLVGIPTIEIASVPTMRITLADGTDNPAFINEATPLRLTLPQDLIRDGSVTYSLVSVADGNVLEATRIALDPNSAPNGYLEYPANVYAGAYQTPFFVRSRLTSSRGEVFESNQYTING